MVNSLFVFKDVGSNKIDIFCFFELILSYFYEFPVGFDRYYPAGFFC